MTYLIILMALLLLALVLIGHFGLKYSEGFESKSDSKELIICKADWCGHCKKAAPEFQKLLAASPITLKDGSKITVKILDADKNKAEIDKYKPKGFPTIFIVDKDNTTEYPGERTYDAVISFLNSNY